MKRVAGALVLLAALVPVLGPGLVEAHFNEVAPGFPRPVSEAARRIHETLLVADLHSDALLWGADLAKRRARGHVDLPRLREGRVAIQGFSVVTQTPRGLNYDRNVPDSDNVTLLALVQLWPPGTWSSLLERALYQAGRLNGLAARSDGRFVVLRTRADLNAFLERRRRETDLVSGFLAIEGAHAMGDDPANVDALFAAGYRMMAPTHFFDNAFGGSAHGATKGGLTAAGREMIRRMEAAGMALDLAHASPATFAEAIAATTKPVVVSHTGVQATCPGPRNLTDEQLRAVAATGGVIGIGFWDSAVCGHDARAIARAIRHAASVAGVEHVAFGSDFDGAVTTPFDAAGMSETTQALLAEGFGEEQIRLIAGDNVVRALRHTLPRGGQP
ncbi:MAG TPA: membrane dipeptidase [Vicinamibacteria bacterium]|nr:membrane dipeptidase [Vicinamibacteria bacterium]